MNKNDYDKYYKKGGNYVIPIEIFNELFDELERLKELSKVDSQQAQEIIIELKQEIERLNNIINKFENSLIESDKYINNSIFKKQLKYLQELKGENND